MHRLYILALSAIGAMALLAAFFVPGEGEAKPERVAVTKKAVVHESEALLLRRDGSGQFHLNVVVNGSGIEFLVDTGADIVALTEEEALALNLPVSSADYEPIMQTASGVGYGAPVTLDEMEIGGVVLHDIDAVVVQGLTTNLLGQSVLRKLGGIELKGDKMVIHPR